MQDHETETQQCGEGFSATVASEKPGQYSLRLNFFKADLTSLQADTLINGFLLRHLLLVVQLYFPFRLP